MNRTKLIDLLLSLNFKVVGHGASIDNIRPHMNFSDGSVRINLTDDNNHIYCMRSDNTYLVGKDPHEERYPVSIAEHLKPLLEPFLLPDESIVTDITNWKYQPYLDRIRKEIEKHNQWCRESGLLDCIIDKEDFE